MTDLRPLIPIDPEENLDEIARQLLNMKPQTPPSNQGTIRLDPNPEDSRNKKTQDQWLDYWSNITDNRIMASMGDLYIAFKQIKEKYNNKTNTKEDDALINSLRDVFNQSWEISSTRLIYSPQSLDARIIHHYNCNIPECVKETNIKVPAYRPELVSTVTNNKEGLAYLRALFDTQDDAETIIQTLEFISNKKRKDIKIWTAEENDRGSYPQRAAGLYYGGGDFRVYGYDCMGDHGCSRGVFINPR